MLFQELRDPPAGQVDSLTVRRAYSIFEVDDEGKMAHVEPQPDLRGHSTWRLNSEPVAIEFVEATTCQIAGSHFFEVGDDLEQVQWLSSHEDLVQEFMALWKPRWQKLPSQSDWSGIANFASAYLPRLAMDFPAVSIAHGGRHSVVTRPAMICKLHAGFGCGSTT